MVKKGTLTEEEASHIARMVTSALVYMHRMNIIHRDLKPENLLLTRIPTSPSDIEVKIIDFGLSKVRTRVKQSMKMMIVSFICNSPLLSSISEVTHLRHITNKLQGLSWAQKGT